VKSGKLNEEGRESASERLVFTGDLSAQADHNIVIEAIAEHEPTKIALLE
jgi:3-hydroxybutyryl-CoA dehydrogenase